MSQLPPSPAGDVVADVAAPVPHGQVLAYLRTHAINRR